MTASGLPSTLKPRVFSTAGTYNVPEALHTPANSPLASNSSNACQAVYIGSWRKGLKRSLEFMTQEVQSFRNHFSCAELRMRGCDHDLSGWMGSVGSGVLP